MERATIMCLFSLRWTANYLSTTRVYKDPTSIAVIYKSDVEPHRKGVN